MGFDFPLSQSLFSHAPIATSELCSRSTDPLIDFTGIPSKRLQPSFLSFGEGCWHWAYQQIFALVFPIFGKIQDRLFSIWADKWFPKITTLFVFLNKCSSELKICLQKYLGCSKRAKDRTCVSKTKHSGYWWTLSSGCRMVPVEGLILRGTVHPQLSTVAERVFKHLAG